MHELGFVFHIIDMLEEVGEENSLTSISRVTLTIGEVTGIVDSYLIDCWRWAADKHDLLRGSELVIEPVPAVTICNSCGKTYPTLEFGKTCPHCSSGDTVLLRGQEIEVKEIEAC